MRRLLLVPFAAAVVAASAGCGGGGGNASHAAADPAQSPLVVDAQPNGQLKFTKQQLTAAAGKVTLVLHNPSPVEHNIAIKGNGVAASGKVVAHGGTSTVEADLAPGTYTFYCTVPGHAAAGMTGTLRVR